MLTVSEARTFQFFLRETVYLNQNWHKLLSAVMYNVAYSLHHLGQVNTITSLLIHNNNRTVV